MANTRFEYVKQVGPSSRTVAVVPTELTDRAWGMALLPTILPVPLALLLPPPSPPPPPTAARSMSWTTPCCQAAGSWCA
jgi:hypothetical protein